MDKQTIQGKTIVVTGASSGAGRAIAMAFAQPYVNLVLVARREKALEEVAALCRESGANAAVAVCDVTDADALKAVAQKAVDDFGGLDVWVNNAGVLAAGPFEETPVAVHNRVIQTNLMGYVHGAHAAMPHFKEQGYGILINNISVGGWMPTPYAAGYTASKWGIRGFSGALRGELVRFPHIHVCDLYPAFLDTPGIQHAGNYTGRFLKPAPPVYDPQNVGKAVVALVQRPKNTTIVGIVSPLLKAAYSLAPGLTLKATALTMETYLKQAPSLPHTAGNLFEPEAAGTSIHGGWNSTADAEDRRKKGLFLLAAVAAGVLLLRRL